MGRPAREVIAAVNASDDRSCLEMMAQKGVLRVQPALDDTALVRELAQRMRLQLSGYGSLPLCEGANGRKLNVPVRLLLADDDPLVSDNDLASWQQFTSSDFGFETMSGGHFSPLEQPSRLASVLVRLS